MEEADLLDLAVGSPSATFHVMHHLGEARDHVRKSGDTRLAGRDRRYIKGQNYTLLSRGKTFLGGQASA
jgi:hypothetical protein